MGSNKSSKGNGLTDLNTIDKENGLIDLIINAHRLFTKW